MKIIEFCPYFNESKIAEIKQKESSYWLDELHIIEANATFNGDPKAYGFKKAAAGEGVFHHKIDGGFFRSQEPNPLYYDDICRGAHLFDLWYWQLLETNATFYNEAVQRNWASNLADNVCDDDIVILSDIDEIIDSRYAQKIIDLVRKHKVITIRLYYTAFYLNLFADNNHGMPFFSYRLYALTGRFFKTMPFSSDYLRKKGIEGALREEVYCDPERMGFHHSWLDCERNSEEKLNAFIGNVNDKDLINGNFADQCIKEKRLSYMDASLHVDNDLPFIRAISEIDTRGLWYPG